MGVISPDELIAFMSGIDLTPAQVDAAKLIIDGVQAEIETAINRSIEPVRRTEVVTADHLGRLWPLHTPIISVESVQAGTPLAVVGYDFAEGLVTVSYGGDYTITYVGGIGHNHRAHNHLKLEVLRLCSREMTNRHDDTLGVKDLNVNDEADPLPIGLTEDDLKRFKRWRRRTVI